MKERVLLNKSSQAYHPSVYLDGRVRSQNAIPTYELLVSGRKFPDEFGKRDTYYNKQNNEVQ